MGRQGDRLGPADTCQLRKPSSVTSDGANIYIGQPKKILEIGITSHIPTPVPSILTTGTCIQLVVQNILNVIGHVLTRCDISIPSQ